MNTYYVYGNLNHDGKDYRRGDMIDLSDEAASTLLQIGVIGNESLPPQEAAPVPEPAKDVPAEPVAGGEPATSGEPSIDANEPAAVQTEAVDVTPQVSERMTREELEGVAAKEGVAPEAVQAASTKASLVSLIEANRAPLAADPSVGL